jgi:uncharacterized membrane protein
LFGLFRLSILEETNEKLAYLKFSSLFSLVMLVCLFALISLVYRLLPEAKHRSFLLLLPAPLYFTLNRFDVLPGFLCILSLVMISAKKWSFAGIILAVAAMTKWYPVLFLPAYAIYSYQVQGKISWRMVVLFFVTCLLIVLPTLLYGGIDALLVPYRFQGVRGLETLSLPAMIRNIEMAISQNPIDRRYYLFGFLFLQVAASMAAFFSRIDEFGKLVLWCLLITSTFVLFARIYSPQWCLWILPLLILVSKDKFDLAVILLYGVVLYIGFPVFFDSFGERSSAMKAMSLINIAFLMIITSKTIWRIWKKQTPVSNSFISDGNS